MGLDFASYSLVRPLGGPPFSVLGEKNGRHSATFGGGFPLHSPNPDPKPVIKPAFEGLSDTKQFEEKHTEFTCMSAFQKTPVTKPEFYKIPQTSGRPTPNKKFKSPRIPGDAAALILSMLLHPARLLEMAASLPNLLPSLLIQYAALWVTEKICVCAWVDKGFTWSSLRLNMTDLHMYADCAMCI